MHILHMHTQTDTYIDTHIRIRAERRCLLMNIICAFSYVFMTDCCATFYPCLHCCWKAL